MTKLFFASLLFLYSALLLTGCGETSETEATADLHLHSGQVMGTWYSVKYLPPADTKLSLAEIDAQIDAKLNAVDALMSTYKPDSEVSRFNAAKPDEWFEVSPQTYDVIALAQSISKKTAGAFDISVARLVDLWGFGPLQQAQRIPDAQQLANILNEVGYQNLQLHDSELKLLKKTPLHIDLSAIAKGFGVDQVANYLDRIAVQSFLVEVGGEIRARGLKPGGKPWRIAIETPDSEQREVHLVLDITDLAVATSGDYRNYFEKDGQRFSHTIDPKTGSPITHNLASVTVIGTTAAEADALATAFSVLGLEQAMHYAETYNIAVYFIVKEQNGFVDRASDAFLAMTQE